MSAYWRPHGEFEIVPDSAASRWHGVFNADSEFERVEALELLSSAIDFCFNPSDGEEDAVSILEAAVLRAADFIARQPCTCTVEDGCDRCYALGRAFNKPLQR